MATAWRFVVIYLTCARTVLSYTHDAPRWETRRFIALGGSGLWRVTVHLLGRAGGGSADCPRQGDGMTKPDYQPAPKPAPSPATHLAALAAELDWLNLNANKLPGVSAGEAADIRSVIADLGSWVRLKMGAL